MELSPVNERIKMMWKQTGLTQQVFAGRIGCKQQHISSAVTNKYQPGLDLLTGILVAFPDVSSEWLLLGNGNMLKGEASEDALKQKELLNKCIKGKEYDIKSETIIIEESGKCESCKKRNNRIEFLEDLLRDRDTEIARLNQEIGRLNPNHDDPKKGKAHYG